MLQKFDGSAAAPILMLLMYSPSVPLWPVLPQEQPELQQSKFNVIFSSAIYTFYWWETVPRGIVRGEDPLTASRQNDRFHLAPMAIEY